MAIDHTLPQRLQSAREERFPNMLQAEVARRILDGLVKTTTAADYWGKWERGDRDMPPKHFPAVAHRLGVRETWLRTGRGPRRLRARLDFGGTFDRTGTVVSGEEHMPESAQALKEMAIVEGDYTFYIADEDMIFIRKDDVLYAEGEVRPDEALNKRCVATLKDGSRRLCSLAPSTTGGLYVLYGLGG